MTRKRVLLFGCFFALACVAPTPGPLPTLPSPPVDPPIGPQEPAVHGMVLFGEKQIFLSHLPLFHPPHDFQILLAADFTVEDGVDPQAVYLQDRQTTGEKLYTLVPEPFSLSELQETLAKGESFSVRADVVRGHFERGGETIVSGAKVNIRQKFRFRQLDPKSERPEGSRYILFGKGDEAFLSHLVTARPDFDQLVSIPPPKGIDLEAGFELLIEGQPVDQPLREGQPITVRLEGLSPQTLQVGTELFLETGDLSF